MLMLEGYTPPRYPPLPASSFIAEHSFEANSQRACLLRHAMLLPRTLSRSNLTFAIVSPPVRWSDTKIMLTHAKIYVNRF